MDTFFPFIHHQNKKENAFEQEFLYVEIPSIILNEKEEEKEEKVAIIELI